MAIGSDGTGEVNGYHIAPFADLRGADLQGADLSRANLQGVNLEGAHLDGATLIKANLTYYLPLELQFPPRYMNSTQKKAFQERKAKSIIRTNLKDASLADAKLMRADLSGAELQGANLQEANLTGATLDGVRFNKANLTGADLSEARLSATRFLEADLTNALFIDSHISGSNFIGANLSGTNFSFSYVTGAQRAGDMLWSGAIFENTLFIGANLDAELAKILIKSGGDLSAAIVPVGYFEELTSLVPHQALPLRTTTIWDAMLSANRAAHIRHEEQSLARLPYTSYNSREDYEAAHEHLESMKRLPAILKNQERRAIIDAWLAAKAADSAGGRAPNPGYGTRRGPRGYRY